MFIILITSSCGDLFMTEKGKSSFGSRLLGAKCDFDSDAFSEILERNIKGDILCVADMVDLLLKFVKTDRPGVISKKTLLDVLDTDIVDVGDDDIVPIVESLFELSFLIFGGENGYIVKRDMDKIIDLLVFFNANVWKVYKLFDSDDKVNFSRHISERTQVENAMILISDKLSSMINRNRAGRVDTIDTVKFLENFFKGKNQQDKEDLDKIKSLLFLKTIFLGGTKKSLNNIELADSIAKIPALMAIAFDLSKTEKFDFKDDTRKMFEVYNQDIVDVRKSLFYGRYSTKKVASFGEVFDALEKLIPEVGDPDAEEPEKPTEEGADTVADNTNDEEVEEEEPIDFSIYLRKFPREIAEIKRILTGGERPDEPENAKTYIDTKELYTILDHGSNIFDEAEFFFNMYDEYEDDLNSPQPISIDFSDYPVFSERERMFRDHFAEIAYKYKYFKGSETSPTFGFSYKRNATGMVEISALEYAFKVVMSEYGEEHPDARGGYHMQLATGVKPLIEQLKRLLQELGLTKIGRKYKKDDNGNFLPFPAEVDGNRYAPEVTSTAENLVLMATLFQNQSDGCNKNKICMEVPEITEFFVGVLTAMKVRDSFNDLMRQECGKDVDQYGRFHVRCFKNKFLTVLSSEMADDDGKRLADYMPLLHSYVKELQNSLEPGQEPIESAKYSKFINETDSFTRTCSGTMVQDSNGDEVELAMTETDAFGIFAGLLNVESTLLRFDINENNKMDDGCDDNFLRKYKICKKTASETNEVLSAYYEVYEGAIQSLVAPNGGFMTKLSKSIFQYLVKYGKTPDTSNFNSLWDYAKFLVRVNKRADATRTTIATILKTLGVESDNAKDYPFKCEECAAGDPDKLCQPDDGKTWEYNWQDVE